MFSIIWPKYHNWLDSIRDIITHLISNVEKIKKNIKRTTNNCIVNRYPNSKAKKKKKENRLIVLVVSCFPTRFRDRTENGQKEKEI